MEGYYLEQIGRVLGIVLLAGMAATVVGIVIGVRRSVRRERRSKAETGEGNAEPPRRSSIDEPEKGPDGDDPGAERGAGTVLVLGIAAVVIVLGLALAAIGAAQQTRGTAQAAADLGALAAAGAMRHGLDPCEVAGEAVARNRAQLASCTPEGGGVVALSVTKVLGAAPAWAGGQAGARARAGPRPGS